MGFNLFEYGFEFAKIFDYEIVNFEDSRVIDNAVKPTMSNIFANSKPYFKQALILISGARWEFV
jgi:hypothetical protein